MRSNTAQTPALSWWMYSINYLPLNNRIQVTSKTCSVCNYSSSVLYCGEYWVVFTALCANFLWELSFFFRFSFIVCSVAQTNSGEGFDRLWKLSAFFLSRNLNFYELSPPFPFISKLHVKNPAKYLANRLGLVTFDCSPRCSHFVSLLVCCQRTLPDIILHCPPFNYTIFVIYSCIHFIHMAKEWMRTQAVGCRSHFFFSFVVVLWNAK